jgi:hypothetical protein
MRMRSFNPNSGLPVVFDGPRACADCEIAAVGADFQITFERRDLAKPIRF